MVLAPLSEAISQRKSVGLCSPVVELFPLCEGFEVFRLPRRDPHPCWVLMLVPCGVHDTVKEQHGWVAGAFWAAGPLSHCWELWGHFLWFFESGLPANGSHSHVGTHWVQPWGGASSPQGVFMGGLF